MVEQNRSTLDQAHKTNKTLQDKLLDGSIERSNDPSDHVISNAYKRLANKEHPGTTDFDIEGYCQGYMTMEMDTTLEYFGTDTYEQLQNTLNDEHLRKLFIENGWMQKDGRPVPIEYKINKLGFRDHEHTFDDSEPSILVIGVSDVCGMGMHFEDIWPTQLGKVMGLKVYNMGTPMGSLDTTRRLHEYWDPILKPEYTFISYANTIKRFEIDGKHIGPWHSETALKRLGVYDLYHDENWSKDRIKRNFEYFKEHDNIRLLTESLGGDVFNESDVMVNWYVNALENKPGDTQSVSLTGEKYGETLRTFGDLTFARDMVHPGAYWHKLVAQTFLETI
jgi:hypothetical protein